MVPTMLLIGLLAGRWVAVPVGGIAWVVVLLASGVIGLAGVPAAFVVAAANVAVGVVVRQAIALSLRRPRTLS